MRRCVAWKWFIVVLGLGSSGVVHAQSPQDNWYLEATWAKTMAATNGGLSTPYGVAIGPDGRIYVGDEGLGCIQIYSPNGLFSSSITNGFGGGQRFSQPRGMITDMAGHLYVADYATNCVFVFDKNGGYVRRIGGTTGAGDGCLSGVMDVGVARNGDVYIVERGNHRVSVFNSNGVFLRNWGGLDTTGTLGNRFYNPVGLAVSLDDKVFVCQLANSSDPALATLKVFDLQGTYIRTLCQGSSYSFSDSGWWVKRAPTSVRVDASGYVHVLIGLLGAFNANDAVVMMRRVYDRDGLVVGSQDFTTPSTAWTSVFWPCSATGLDGSIVFCLRDGKTVYFCRRAYREQWAPPYNAIPMPIVVNMQQRPQSPCVDIDYQVTDADDTNVCTAVLAFKNGVQSVSNCIRNLTLVEGTTTNIGPGIMANELHRITWNAGADWGTNLGDYRVAILARDSRTNLLDVHYLHLPAGNGMPALTISRSPLVQNDYMHVWWWLLATGDTGIGLNTQRIVAVGGDYNGQILCDASTTTVLGRSNIYQRMNVREATPAEVNWARQAALPGNTNQWSATLNVGGRPASVNEYGFDTGNWGTNAFWIVPQN